VAPIRILPDTVVNRIAAGEVVERPASAVKELIENALDAGARRVHVALVGGGIERIEVVDDGYGMGPADLALAVQRHATSKLPAAENGDTLVRITQLGFRGEALPSLGAAARLSLTSRTASCTSAHRIRVEGGQVGPVEPAPGSPGTRAVVADLFFATPARRKFLKQPRSEAEHAEQAVRRLALAAPEVAFRLEIEERAALNLPPQDRAARAAALLGPEAAALLREVSGERDGVRVSGFAGLPSHTRATAAGQLFAVNGRPVADPVLRTALRVAYQGTVAAGRHGVAALWLDVPGDSVDVNVHPAKLEVRFRDAASVRSLVIGAVGRALAGGGTSPRPVSFSRPATRYAPAMARTPGFAEAPLPFLGAPPAARPAAPETPREDYPLGAAIAQVLDTYVLAVAADGSLVVVDQHAAHERLTHEALRGQLADGGVRAQPLLMPAVVELPLADCARLVARAAELARLGLELEAFGTGAVLVRALPALLGSPDPAPLLRDLADELAEGDELSPLGQLDARLDAAVARLACHGSVRAGQRLDQAAMNALLRRMEAAPRAATCPHGRPTVLKLSRAEIERLFGRR
jgi:DNA mismatch repair protein MutL